MNKNSWIITIIIAVIVGGVAFFGGMQYQKMQRSELASRYGGQGGAGGYGRFGGGAGNGSGGAMQPVIGQIVSSDSNSITVKLADGSSKIVDISSSTSINKMAKGSQADLTNGTRVAVLGQTNSDGSVTAQTVQVNPQMRRGPSGTNPPSAQ